MQSKWWKGTVPIFEVFRSFCIDLGSQTNYCGMHHSVTPPIVLPFLCNSFFSKSVEKGRSQPHRPLDIVTIFSINFMQSVGSSTNTDQQWPAGSHEPYRFFLVRDSPGMPWTVPIILVAFKLKKFVTAASGEGYVQPLMIHLIFVSYVLSTG